VAKKGKEANGVLKNKDLVRFRDGLKAVISSGKYGGEFKFTYAVVKTHRLVESELAVLQGMISQTEEWKKFDKLRQELVMKHAKKDKDGKPVTFQDGNAVKTFIEDEDLFNGLLEKLRTKHAKAVKEKEAADAEFNKFLDEPASIKVHTVPKDIVPKDLTPQHLEGIFEIVA